MASPDFSQYINLTVDDRDAADVYDDAVEYARLAFPEFTPRVGTIEDSILQACALMASLNLGTINRLPHGLMEGILNLMGFTRFEATFSTVEVEFTLANDGETVPNDFFVVYEAVVGDETVQYPFKTTSEATADALESTVTATLVCDVPGVIPTLLSGTELVIVQPNATVLSCVTTALVQQGDEAETDDEYFARATSYLASLSTSLVTAAQIEEFVISRFPDVHRCKVYDLRNPVIDTTGSITFSGSTGYAQTTASFVTNSDFTDYTRVINKSATTAGQDSVVSGVYNTTATGASVFTFTPEGDLDTTPVPATFIDMIALRTSTPADSAGYFVIFVCDENGAPLTNTIKTAIYDSVAARIVAGLSFLVLDALVCDIELSVDISIDNEYSAASVVASVADELESFISPDNWPEWHDTIRLFDVVVRANSVQGVSYVNTVTASIPEYNDTPTAIPGNELIVQEVNPGSGVTALQMLYAGTLPRATVEVTVS